jgi:hypothetical protein
MLLTEREREFLAAFIYEATTDPFKGPATEELHRRDIYYTDLPHLLAAYYRENPGYQQGFAGNKVATLPHCPWSDRETVARRDQQVGIALERAAKQAVS